MSRPKSHTVDSVRQMLSERIADPDFNLSELERQLGGSPTRQALKKFAEGAGGASFWERVGRVLRGESDVPSIAEEAEAALRLVREAEAALLRVTERLRADPVEIAKQTALAALAESDLASESSRPETGSTNPSTAPTLPGVNAGYSGPVKA